MTETSTTPPKSIVQRIDEAVYRVRRQGWEPSRLKLSEADLTKLKAFTPVSTVKVEPPGQPDRYRDIPLIRAKVSGLDLVGRDHPEPI